jgi:hypothetical protein
MPQGLFTGSTPSASGRVHNLSIAYPQVGNHWGNLRWFNGPWASPIQPADESYCDTALHTKSDESHYNGWSSHFNDPNFLTTCGPFVGRMIDGLNRTDRHMRSWWLARWYFDSQQRAIRASAAHHRVHPYFLGWEHGAPTDKPLKEVITHRMRHWTRRQRVEDSDDFLVEKSKCAMISFFQRNGLPTAPVLGRGIYSSPHDMGRALAAESSSGALNVTRWPIFVKACHITQGSLRSVKMIKSAHEMGWTLPKLRCWLRRMYAMRADDRDRPWTKESNSMTDTVAPGFFVQAGVPSWRDEAAPKDGRGPKAGVTLELKVEVCVAAASMLPCACDAAPGVRSVARSPSCLLTCVCVAGLLWPRLPRRREQLLDALHQRRPRPPTSCAWPALSHA